MAPNGETLVASCYSKNNNFNSSVPQKPRRISMEGLQRALSDLSFQLTNKEAAAAVGETATSSVLPPISEVEDAKCECCGMSEECTQEYIRRVRDKYSGKWICGLCSEAVKEEMAKDGRKQLAEAVEAHMGLCVRFNRIGRTHPVLFQADAMRELLRKSSSRGARTHSSSPRDREGVMKGSIARSSSCIPAITKEINKCRAVN